jgi:uncharacterized OsmC-like protein
MASHHQHDCSCGQHTNGASSITAASLREKQAPIKDSYKQDPSKALVTLSSEGSLSSTSIACKLSTGAAVKEAKSRVAGLHPMAGGADPEISGELCSGDMLLEALVACAGVTMKAVATALSLPMKDGTIRAEGDLDFRGTLGVDRDAPVGFKEIRLSFDINFDTEVTEEQVERLSKLTERYCVVLQTIAKKPELKVRVRGAYESEDGIERAELCARKI